MGAGNVCVFGTNEGLYYVDNKYFDVVEAVNENGEAEAMLRDEAEERKLNYRPDEVLSTYEYEDFLDELKTKIKERFSSFSDVDNWERDRHIILENKLFKIAIEDNQWSYAVELLENSEPSGLHTRNFNTYFNYLKEVLLLIFPEIGTYSSAWTHGTIRRNDKCSV